MTALVLAATLVVASVEADSFFVDIVDAIPCTTEEAFARYQLAGKHLQFCEEWHGILASWSQIHVQQQRRQFWSITHDLKAEVDAIRKQPGTFGPHDADWRAAKLRQWYRLLRMFGDFPSEIP